MSQCFLIFKDETPSLFLILADIDFRKSGTQCFFRGSFSEWFRYFYKFLSILWVLKKSLPEQNLQDLLKKIIQKKKDFLKTCLWVDFSHQSRGVIFINLTNYHARLIFEKQTY